MSEWRQFTRLPESPEYWRALRHRIDGATHSVVVVRSTRERWYDRALATAVVAAAALVALLLVQTEPPPAGVSLQTSLAPDDPVALELLASQAAPHISGLLPVFAPGPVQ